MKYYNSMGQDITETVSNQFNGLNLKLQDCQETIQQKNEMNDELSRVLAKTNNVCVELQEKVEKLEKSIKKLKKKRRTKNVNT